MKFIWLITIFLICLRLCFCFLCCNTSLPTLPAFIQCLTDSRLREQTEGFHKKHAAPWSLAGSLWSHLKSRGREKQHSNVGPSQPPIPLPIHALNPSPPGRHPLCSISFICQTPAVLYLDYSIVILLLPQNSNRQIPISLPRSQFQSLTYLLEEPKHNFISSFLDCPSNKK